MGLFNWLDAAGDWAWDHVVNTGRAYRDAWTTNLKENSESLYGGALTMLQSGGDNRDSFGKGFRMFADSLLGLAGETAFKGTIGGLFELPGLKETGWLLDKAYRYTWAYPTSYYFQTLTGTAMTGREALAKDGAAGAYQAELNYLTEHVPWGNHGIYSSEVQSVTPGQAFVWGLGGQIGMLNPGNTNDPTHWLRTHDPRTAEGQAAYNGPDSEFLLKYGSGTFDLLGNIAVDPSVPAAGLLRYGKNRFDNVATPDYIRKGGVDAEVTSERYNELLRVAKDPSVDTPEKFRALALNDARYGGRVAPVLWAAAKIDDDLFRDAYVVARGMDGVFSPTGGGAWKRIQDRAPEIASSLARQFANWNIGEDMIAYGRNAESTAVVNSLALNDVDAFIMALDRRQGAWGKLPGLLAGEAQPKVNRLDRIRYGVHSRLVAGTTITVGKPLVKTLQAFMASQGHTRYLDAYDGTALALRQFKANMERSGLEAGRVEWWTSQWGAKNTPEGRSEVFERAEIEAIASVAERHGIDPETVRAAMPEINRYRSAARQIVQQQRVYLSERAVLLGAKMVKKSREHQTGFIKQLSEGLSKRARKGEYDDAMLAIPDVDGHTMFQPVQDSRRLPEQGADPNKPLLSTQTERLIPTVDYRALDSALRWWKLQHPEAGASLARQAGGKAAKVHSVWQAALTAGDFINMVWKASALLRPAQMPRNLADDVFRRLLILGKGHLIMSAMRGTRRVYQNVGPRGRLLHEVYGAKRVKMQAEGDTTLRATVDVDLVDDDGRSLAGDLVRQATAYLKKGDEARAKEIAEGNPYLPDELGVSWLNNEITVDELIEAGQAWGASRFEHRRVGYLETLLDRYKLRTLKVGDIKGKGGAGGMSFITAPGSMAALKKEIEENEKGNNAAEMKNELVRQILEYYADRSGTKIAFLDAHEPNMFEDRTRSDLSKWIDDVVTIHRARLHSDEPYRAGQLVVQPINGHRPTGEDGFLENYSIIQEHNLNHMIKKNGDLNANVTRWLEAFILRNIDQFKRNDIYLSLQVNAHGSIRMGVAKKKPAPGEPPKPIEVSARRRRRNFKFEGIRDAGHDRISVAFKHRDGSTHTESYDFEGAREGPEGELFMNRLSALGGQGSYNYIVGDFNQDRIFDQMSGQWGYSEPGEKGYPKTWERIVNAQIAGDPVARMFLEGATESDVLRWIENTPEGTMYLQRAKHHGVVYSDHVSQIKGMVDDYIPFEDTPKGKLLRQAVLERKAEYHHLEAVRPDVADQPIVHGASTDYLLGKGAVFKMVARGLDKMQQLLSDLPTDKASRYPFFDESYRRHLHDLVRTADERVSKATLDGDVVDAAALRNIQLQARERALYDTKYRLYDVAQVNDLAKFSRYVVPFANAIMDSYVKYGRIVRDTAGGAILKGLYYWEMFDRNEAVQDENGHVKRFAADGSEIWYKIDPETQEMVQVPIEEVGTQRYVQFSLPSDLANVVGLGNYYGSKANPVFAVNKKNFNVFIDLPTSGPLVALPANKFALDNPEFGESELIKKFVLPFGPSVSRGRIFLPSTVRTAWDTFVTEDGEKAEAQAKGIFQAELIAYGRGERDSPPSFAEAREKAAALKGLRFSSAWITPVSMQAVSPFQMYIDTYRQMVAVDPQGADEKFLAQYGDEYYAVAMTVSRNNAGIKASLESDKAFKAHTALIDSFPEYAGLIVGADGGTFSQFAYTSAKEEAKAKAFSKSVYESQKQTPLKTGSSTMVRQVMNLQESTEDLEKRRVWTQYTKMHDLILAEMEDRGLTSLRGKRGQDLAKLRDSFIQANMTWVDPQTGVEVLSPWYKDYTVNDSAAMENRIMAMRQIIKDPSLQNRDDMRGLAEYLTARNHFQEKMVQRGYASLTSQKASAARAEWEKISLSIREKNPAFAQVWARWLSHDEELSTNIGGAR